MSTITSPPTVYATMLRARAQQVADKIVAACPQAKAVLLYGSAQTGSARAGSDIDLAVLSDEPISGRDLELLVPDLEDRSLNITYLSPRALERSYARDWSFVACLHDTGALLAGDRAALTWLDRPKPDILVTAVQMDDLDRWMERRAAEAIDDAVELSESRWLVEALHELYRTVRQIIVLYLAHHDEGVYDRRAALAALSRRRPDLAEDIQVIAALEGCWLAEHRGDELADSDIPTADDAQSALACARRIVAALREEIGREDLGMLGRSEDAQTQVRDGRRKPRRRQSASRQRL